MTDEARGTAANGKPVERRSDYKHLRLTISVAAGILTVGALVGGVASALGFKRWGPPEQIEVLRTEVVKADSALATRVIALEAIAQQNRTGISELKNEVAFNSYLMCVMIRRTDPAAEPRDCRGRAP